MLKLQPNSKLVMIGDSITDAGRKTPFGEGRNEGTGRGYVAHVETLLGTVYPQHAIRVVNVGSSGNTVRNLKSRWQTDVLDLKPDWLSVMIGINDVWRQFDSPLQKEGHVLIEEYEATLNELLAQTRPALKGLALFTPYYIEANAHDAMRAQMDRYGQIVKKQADRHNAIFVDTQAVFNDLLKSYYPAALAWDRVHPSQVGHMAMARAFLNAVGFDWNGGR
jgi:lysophospholipase L1-like esterase